MPDRAPTRSTWPRRLFSVQRSSVVSAAALRPWIWSLLEALRRHDNNASEVARRLLSPCRIAASGVSKSRCGVWRSMSDIVSGDRPCESGDSTGISARLGPAPLENFRRCQCTSGGFQRDHGGYASRQAHSHRSARLFTRQPYNTLSTNTSPHRPMNVETEHSPC